ncbi:hypothetical protein CFC21_098770 [Triticum aestivum]|uniref:DUF6598 domain-containing protein n=3 Tax=Triticum TaxID=4564 RepID=A0A9R0ZJ03_TRITD|nr:uncharacterized protein LOC123151906 [Triticum aestivum]KAF7096882.1 hypothetical protein CFC21_098770 [Triticum aestivum]VAI77794.1 unnamed protein product [Triticum turgidum subsp. durum]
MLPAEAPYLPAGRYPRDPADLTYPSDLFGPAPQRLHDPSEQHQEVVVEGEVVAAAEEKQGIGSIFSSIDKHDDPALKAEASEPPILHWDDVCLSDSDDDLVDQLNLADLAGLALAHSDDDEEEGVTDGEETNCPGKKFPREKAKLIQTVWVRSDIKQNEEHRELCKMLLDLGHEWSALPPFPMKVFPHVIGACVLRGYCHHRIYRTHHTSTTKSTLGYREPNRMLQVFSLRLSSSASYPVSVYGIIAVRDSLEPLRNYVFNRPCRDDAVTIDQDSFILPLCSPCRGMYLRQDALLEVDLWVKEEGDGSADKQILSAYAEIESCPAYDEMLYGQIRHGLFSLDIGYISFTRSIEAVIEVFAKVDGPHHVRFGAFSSGFDHEIVLFDDTFSGTKMQFQHVVVVKAEEKLDVCLKLGESLFRWSFQDGHVGPVRIPDDSMSKYGQFDVRVFFAPKNSRPPK